jgi:uncharacterized protein YwqG
MEKNDLIEKLARQATEFITGGFKPTNSMQESWIGRVYIYAENEEIPRDQKGELMFPLVQFCLKDLPFVPNSIKDIEIITLFVAKEFPYGEVLEKENWVLREYRSNDKVIFKDLYHIQSSIRGFPLMPKLAKKDFPAWDSNDISEDLCKEILKLEEQNIISSYSGEIEQNYLTKIGGYPSYCQPGPDIEDNWEFIFQIASDEKANINIIDAGNLYFFKSKNTGEWEMHYDFF